MLIAVIVGMLQASSGAGTPLPAPAPSIITNPDWLELPSRSEVGKHYPKAALRDDLAGRVVVRCTVNSGGRLVQCGVNEVTPTGAGFEAAALALAASFRMRPTLQDGRPIEGGFVRIPIFFWHPSDVRAAPITTRHPEVPAGVVELDCRYKAAHLDNCFPKGASDPKAAEIALKLADEVTLPPMSRAQGRIALPIIFAGQSETQGPPELVTTPRWLSTPDRTEVYRSYPEAARKSRQIGRVVTECRVTSEGKLAECSVIEETPKGAGFGAGAIHLMSSFRLAPEDGFGLKVEGRKIRIPVAYSPPPRPKRGTG